MSLRISVVAFALLLAPALISFSEPGTASAHEHRAVGNYEFVVGWLDEPALAYEPNGLDLRVTLFPNGVPAEEEEGAEGAEEEQGQPVEGLEETLQAEIIAGGGAETRQLTLEPAFRDPGHYEGRIIPTVPGDYTFRITGNINGQKINEEFSSGPETFSVIEDPAEQQFPEELPTTKDLSEQIANLDNGGSDSDTATILAIVGIVAGVVGIAVGGIALATRRS